MADHKKVSVLSIVPNEHWKNYTTLHDYRCDMVQALLLKPNMGGDCTCRALPYRADVDHPLSDKGCGHG
jgi:hypothetical protein